MQTLRYYFFLWIHIILLSLWYSSPFWLDWRLVIASVLVYYIQLYFWRGCLVTSGQFGNENQGFYYHYLTKFGFHPNRKVLNIVLDFVIPISVILIAILRQVIIPHFNR